MSASDSLLARLKAVANDPARLQHIIEGVEIGVLTEVLATLLTAAASVECSALKRFKKGRCRPSLIDDVILEALLFCDRDTLDTMQLICRFFRNIIAESEGKELALRTLDRVYVHVPSAVRKAVGPDDLTQLQKVGSTDAMDETFFTALGRRGIRHFRFNVHESGFVGFAEADAGGERSIRGIGWVTGPDELIPRLREKASALDRRHNVGLTLDIEGMLDEVIGEEDYKKYNVEMDDDANFNCVIDDLENGIKLTFSETDGQDSVYRITVLSSH